MPILDDDQLPSADQDEERSLDMGDLPDGDGDPTTAPVPEKVRARDETRRDETTRHRDARTRTRAGRERERNCLFSSAGSLVRWFFGDAMRID